MALVGMTALAVVMQARAAQAGGYRTPTAGQSPHGNYSDSGSKCKVCHAVHNANTGSGEETLLRSSRENACVFCHISGAWSIEKVYGGIVANYTGDSRYNHDSDHAVQVWGPANYAGCPQCHSVHGANVLTGYESKIVSNDPGPWLPAPVTDLNQFCRDCHEDDNYPGGPYGGEYGWRCGACHNDMFFTRGGEDGVDLVDQYPAFATQARDGVSHVMTTTLTNATGAQVAWSYSDDCRDCHAGGNGTVNNSFPHYTSGAYFLDDQYTPPDGPPGGLDTGMDRVCLNCHAEGGDGGSYTTGVGKTF